MSAMKFCCECNNILCPKEYRENKVIYACRNCDHQEVADSNCVYRNVVDHGAGEFTQVVYDDVASDLTLPRTKSVRCAACGHGEAVFFQATARGEEGMRLFFSSSSAATPTAATDGETDDPTWGGATLSAAGC